SVTAHSISNLRRTCRDERGTKPQEAQEAQKFLCLCASCGFVPLMNLRSLTALLWVSAIAGSVVAGQQTPANVVMTSQQDRQRMMDQLKITMFPSGPGAYLAATYDEKTANPYPNLPDPLTFNNGSKVKTAAQWRKRRAEIVELFDREVYGRRPKNIPKVTWTVASTAEGKAGNIPVVTRQLVGRVDNSGYPSLNVTILATLSTPKNATGPVPVILMFGSGGTLPEGISPTTPCVVPGSAPPRGAGAPAAAAGAARGPLPAPGNAGPSAQEQIAMRGWGYASVSTASIQADNGQGLTCGIIGLVNKAQPRSLEDWGVLSAWGWGMSKVLDYLETDKAV